MMGFLSSISSHFTRGLYYFFRLLNPSSSTAIDQKIQASRERAFSQQPVAEMPCSLKVRQIEALANSLKSKEKISDEILQDLAEYFRDQFSDKAKAFFEKFLKSLNEKDRENPLLWRRLLLHSFPKELQDSTLPSFVKREVVELEKRSRSADLLLKDLSEVIGEISEQFQEELEKRGISSEETLAFTGDFFQKHVGFIHPLKAAQTFCAKSAEEFLQTAELVVEESGRCLERLHSCAHVWEGGEFCTEKELREASRSLCDLGQGCTEDELRKSVWEQRLQARGISLQKGGLSDPTLIKSLATLFYDHLQERGGGRMIRSIQFFREKYGKKNKALWKTLLAYPNLPRLKREKEIPQFIQEELKKIEKELGGKDFSEGYEFIDRQIEGLSQEIDDSFSILGKLLEDQGVSQEEAESFLKSVFETALFGSKTSMEGALTLYEECARQNIPEGEEQSQRAWQLKMTLWNAELAIRVQKRLGCTEEQLKKAIVLARSSIFGEEELERAVREVMGEQVPALSLPGFYTISLD